MKLLFVITAILVLSSCKKESSPLQQSHEKSFVVIEAVQEDGSVITSDITAVK